VCPSCGLPKPAAAVFRAPREADGHPRRLIAAQSKFCGSYWGQSRSTADSVAIAGQGRHLAARNIVAGRLTVSWRYSDFDALWMSLLGSSTPSTMPLATLPDDLRDEVRRRLFDRFGGGTDL
jgi:hypothetical protein